MIKILILAVVLSVVCRWVFGKWPWDYLAPKPTRAQEVFRARKLLGVSATASHAQIIEAHKRLVRQVHPEQVKNLQKYVRQVHPDSRADKKLWNMCSAGLW